MITCEIVDAVRDEKVRNEHRRLEGRYAGAKAAFCLVSGNLEYACSHGTELALGLCSERNVRLVVDEGRIR